MPNEIMVQILTFAAKAARPYRKDQRAANKAKLLFWKLLTVEEQDTLQDAWDAIVMRRGSEEMLRQVLAKICLRLFSHQPYQSHQ
ncbi:MAG TPA: hypothetical protein VFA55_07270 [Candidatus Kapabacteria bacterium]|nr:hypothetical protein [Candidatus Kapabacteria bacterium]